jgi:alkanesulfonate monooxygenase SsuD/methylene tetrahydromethanopterin reductase-like flavin-dependent oxidoreductase (luciferase family)
VTIQPRPFQQPIRIWHGSASSKLSTELAAEYGDPLFSANAMKPVEIYSDLVEHYRERFAFHGHDPATARVAMGVANVVIARNSQDALRVYRELWERLMTRWRKEGFDFPFADFEDWIERSSVLVGSPAQVEDKLARLHARFRNDVVTVGPLGEGLRPADRDTTLDLLATEVIPAIKARIPSPDWGPNGIPAEPARKAG